MVPAIVLHLQLVLASGILLTNQNNMLQWLAYPMVRASLAFGIGILIGLETEFGLPELELGWMVLFGVYWLALKKTKIWYRNCYSCLAVLAMILLILAGVARSKLSQHQPDVIIGQASYFLATVVSPAQLKGKHYSTTLAVSRVWIEDTVWSVDDQVQCYQDSAGFEQLDHGSKIVLKGSPSAIRPPANPREFDYARYMSNKNIFWNYWAHQNSILMYLPGEKGSLTIWSSRLRVHLMNSLSEYLPSGIPQEISMAMLLGDRKAVSERLEDSFTRSGTIHVLAVSGLHLGILYWMLVRLIGAWRRHFLFKWLFLFFSLIALWGFTLVTGMAPSTQRAAAMFSVLILANTLMKQSNSVNSLAASAFVILWVEPYQLYSVGFQLSFLALSGILYLQPWIAGWWQTKNRLLGYFWELCSVSVSAQLVVLPLSVYYFHQLPVYFLLSNIFVIPLAFSIVVLGVIFFVSLLVPALTSLLAIPLIYLTSIAGFIVNFVADLPHSTLADIQIKEFELFVWYGILGSGMVFLRTRQRLCWQLCLCLSAGLTLVTIYHHFQSSARKQVVVYHIPGHTAVDFISGSYFNSLMDPGLVSDHSEIEYKINSYRDYLDLQPAARPLLSENDNRPSELWMFQGKRLLLIRAPFHLEVARNIKLKSHIVVVSNDSLDELEQALSWIEFDLLVIDGSNRQTRAQRLQKQADELGLKVHNCWEDGYKIINL